MRLNVWHLFSGLSQATAIPKVTLFPDWMITIDPTAITRFLLVLSCASYVHVAAHLTRTHTHTAHLVSCEHSYFAKSSQQRNWKI